VATVAALQARAGGGEGSALILAGYDPVLVTRRTRRRMKSRAHDEVRDGPPNKFVGISPNALVREGNGGEIARSVPAEIRAQTGHRRTWIASSVPAEVRARAQSAYDGGGIARSVPTEIRVQRGGGGTWIASSVPAEIRACAQSADDGGGIAMIVPAEVRARAQTAYKEASAAAPLTMLAEPYPWRAEPVHSSAHTRAYRAYLGASPAAGDPTATVRAGGTADCPKCPTTGRSQCCCKFCISNDQQHTVRTRVSLDCKTGMTEILPGTEWNPPPEPNLCSCSFVVEGTAASFGGFGGGSSGDPTEDECTTGQASQPGWTCYIMCGGSSKTDQEWSGRVQQGVSCNCLPYSPFCIGAKMSCEECRSAAEAMASGYSQSGKIPLYCCPKPDAGFCDELRVACLCKCPPPGNCDRR
jgi:hypothetical protein